MRITHHFCIQSMLLLTGVAALFSQQLTAADSYKLFLSSETNAAEAEQKIKAVLPPQSELRIITVPQECRTFEEAQLQAEAIYAGVNKLPCLIIQDENGPYASLSLRHLTAEALEQARQSATNEQREEQNIARDIAARIFLICAGLATPPIDDTKLANIVAECRELLKHPHADIQQKQFIGFRCLYPALMMQYSRAYTGAHTPISEAKLLEAIEELEAARDLMPTSKLGRLAYDERERLRKARLKAIPYE